jgi:hypothetical protein
MVSDNKYDSALLANITAEWRKMAFVVGITMMQFSPEERSGLNDTYFAERIAFLVEKGLVDFVGDLNQMRHCEIRLSSARR